jgi:hypothetical protein
MDHKKFFDVNGDHLLIRAQSVPEPTDSDFTVENIYQAFKQRLIEELRVNQKTLVNYGEGRGFVNEYVNLIDTTGERNGL